MGGRGADGKNVHMCKSGRSVSGLPVAPEYRKVDKLIGFNNKDNFMT